ncbi:MAG: stage 0 sporulation family protein [Elusimicrobia bacterium]|nr:MAG: stage 0 sporulation family protein [Elusimicrobiota bacterium]
MPIVVGVQIRRTKDVFDFLPEGIDLAIGDKCLVETENGMEAGEVVSPERMIEHSKKKLYRVIKKMDSGDCEVVRRNVSKEKEAFQKVMQKVEEHELKMKLTCVDYTFDCNKLFVYYTAEGRVDFRELIKDLGYLLKTRIQMVQIGVRDEAKMLGGFGPCGLPICCGSFLKSFRPVSIDMAKEQDLSLNPAKISGVCGRLMCCLAYENDFYREARKNFPKLNSKVATEDGIGVVKEVNILREEVTVEYADGMSKKLPRKEVSPAGFFEKFKFRKSES